MGPDNFDPVVEEIKQWWDSIDDASWSFDEIIGQKPEHSPIQLPRSVSATANVNPLDDLIIVTATATLTLETAVGCGGREHTLILNAASATLTIACTGSETLGGASTKATSTRYTGYRVKSDGTNWQVVQMDLATVIGTLAIANGGTGATTASAAWKALSVSQTPLPLKNWGGMNFDGSTDYLDTNALTGIADGKKGSIVWKVRFANAASAVEALIFNTGGTLGLSRSATGNIAIVAENAAGTTILSVGTSGTPCSAAGTYLIMASWDMATAASGRLYVDQVSNYAETTFTNDTIDYTVTEYAIGGTAAGGSLFAGDNYVVWFDATSNLEFNTESVRRKFVDSNGVMVYMGANGELPTGTAPILFLAYDPYTSWGRNRGSATSAFVTNGTPAAATTALSGQVFDREDVGIPITVTADYTVDDSDVTIINNRAATNTLTLPNAALYKGRKLRILTIQAQTVVSASSNVIPVAGGAAGTAILAGVDGAFCTLQAGIDGNWQIIA